LIKKRILKSIVIFGAGKIGRSFLGQVFSTGGYWVIFVDINKYLVNELNYHKEYNVIIKDEKEIIIPVFNVRAIHLSDEDSLMNELDNTSIAAVAVGKKGLPSVVQFLARSLERRQHRKAGFPLDLIIAEDMRDSDIYIKEELKKYLPGNFPFEKNIGLIEASIEKMAPDSCNDKINHGSLAVYAEAFNTLILSKKNFLNPIPHIPELSTKDNIKAWVDRKQYIHNFGQAALAYLSSLTRPAYLYAWEANNDMKLNEEVYQSMKESATILQSIYPGEFTGEDLEIYIINLLKRFGNKALGNTLYNLGCDLSGKLGFQDRIVPLIHIAFKNNLPYNKILKVLIAGILFPGKDSKGNMIESDRQFFNQYNRDLEKILRDHCKFDVSREKPIFKEASRILSDIRNK
jgi:mannitol-1-phosphate 5-dehydrogenase